MAKLRVTKTKTAKINGVGKAVAGRVKVTQNRGLQKTANPFKKTTGFVRTQKRTVPTPSLKYFRKSK